MLPGVACKCHAAKSAPDVCDVCDVCDGPMAAQGNMRERRLCARGQHCARIANRSIRFLAHCDHFTFVLPSIHVWCKMIHFYEWMDVNEIGSGWAWVIPMKASWKLWLLCASCEHRCLSAPLGYDALREISSSRRLLLLFAKNAPESTAIHLSPCKRQSKALCVSSWSRRSQIIALACIIEQKSFCPKNCYL